MTPLEQAAAASQEIDAEVIKKSKTILDRYPNAVRIGLTTAPIMPLDSQWLDAEVIPRRMPKDFAHPRHDPDRWAELYDDYDPISEPHYHPRHNPEPWPRG